MKLRKEIQLNEIEDEVLAITSLVRPILTGTLYSVAEHKASAVGGYDKVTLDLLPSLHREGDGDCGICFEYAVHDAIKRSDQRVLDRLDTAMTLCKVKGTDVSSLLFGIEKSGSLQLIATAMETLTDDSQLMVGKVGRPAKLKRHISSLAGAFRNRNTRLALPHSIRGLWKADLFVGNERDQWIGTTVKVNPKDLKGEAGLRVGIVPIRQGRTDKVHLDASKNLVVCPLHHDFDFMQSFYEAWRIVQAFLAADAKMPKEIDLEEPSHREVCRILFKRRKYPVVEVIDSIEKFGQRRLVRTDNEAVGQNSLKGDVETELLVTPVSLDRS